MRLDLLKFVLLFIFIFFLGMDAGLSAWGADEVKADVGSGVVKRKGVIRGRVLFASKWTPRGKVIKMGNDPNCLAYWKGKGERPRYETLVFGEKIAGKGRALMNVFVSITKGVKGRFRVKNSVVMDQRGCVYVPHVLGVVVGQKLIFKNSDKTVHNVKSAPRRNKPFNFGMHGGQASTMIFKRSDRLDVSCDSHSWMKGYIHVLRHPYFGVTRRDGRYKIAGLADGVYEISVWHEFKKIVAKRSSQRVVIKDGKMVVVDFVYQIKRRKRQ